MEFVFVILIIAIAGGVLGFFAAKKCKPETMRKIEMVLLCAALGLMIYAAVEVSKAYYGLAALAAGELIRISVPKKKN